MLNPIKTIETVKQEVNAKDFEISNLLILPIPFLLLSKRRKLNTIELITNVMINGFESAIIIIKNESKICSKLIKSTFSGEYLSLEPAKEFII